MNALRRLGAFLVCAVSLLGADLTGKWEFVWQTEGGERRSVLTVKQTADRVEALFPDAKEPVTGTLKDGKLALSGPLYSAEGGATADFQLEGTLSGADLKGKASWGGHEMTYTARKAE